MIIMIKKFPGNDSTNELENELGDIDSVSARLQVSTNTLGYYSRFLVNSDSSVGVCDSGFSNSIQCQWALLAEGSLSIRLGNLKNE